MAWTYDDDVIFDGERRHVVKVVGTGDGTGADTPHTAVDISTLTVDGEAVDRMRIDTIEYDTTVKLLVTFDHTTDDEIANINGVGYLDWSEYGGKTDPQSAGGTGDIIITPVGTGANDQFTVTLNCVKKPA